MVVSNEELVSFAINVEILKLKAPAMQRGKNRKVIVVAVVGSP